MEALVNIYVVYGATGEYSDHQEWPIAAYLKEPEAQRHVTLATNEYVKYASVKDRYELQYGELEDDWNRQYDPNGRSDYTGVHYYYETVSMVDSVEEFLFYQQLGLNDEN